jgi:hypothetical protein
MTDPAAGGQPGNPDQADGADQPGDRRDGPDPADSAGQPADGPGDPDQVTDPAADNPRVPRLLGLRPPTAQAEEMLRNAIIRKAVDLVTGPSGLASFLRTRLLGARLADPSLPLDVGHSADIPAAIRRAVILRDQHCQWPGGYFL